MTARRARAGLALRLPGEVSWPVEMATSVRRLSKPLGAVVARVVLALVLTIAASVLAPLLADQGAPARAIQPIL